MRYVIFKKHKKKYLYFISDQVIDYSCTIIDKKLKRIAAKYYQDFLKNNIVDIIKTAIERLIASHPELKKKITTRGVGFQIHFGNWKKNCNKYYEIKDSRFLAAKIFFLQTKFIWDLISDVIKRDFPEEWKQLQQKIKLDNLSYFFGIWECLAINYRFQSNPHIDTHDIKNGICVIIPIGNFTGGNINIHDFRISLAAKERGIVVLKSSYYLHSNDPVVGDRDSIVLFTAV